MLFKRLPALRGLSLNTVRIAGRHVELPIISTEMVKGSFSLAGTIAHRFDRYGQKVKFFRGLFRNGSWGYGSDLR
jgi:hypothetical protein